MRISDWSSDVCSSDLDRGRARVAGRGADDGRAPGGEFVGDRSANPAAGAGDQRNLTLQQLFHHDSSKQLLPRMTKDKGESSTTTKNTLTVHIRVHQWRKFTTSLPARHRTHPACLARALRPTCRLRAHPAFDPCTAPNHTEQD